MVTGYRDSEPYIGSVHHAFRSFDYIKEFVKDQDDGLFGNREVFEIWGELISDDGDPDGLKIKVEGFRSHFI